MKGYRVYIKTDTKLYIGKNDILTVNKEEANMYNFNELFNVIKNVILLFNCKTYFEI